MLEPPEVYVGITLILTVSASLGLSSIESAGYLSDHARFEMELSMGVMRMRVRPPRIRECDSLSVGIKCRDSSLSVGIKYRLSVGIRDLDSLLMTTLIMARRRQRIMARRTRRSSLEMKRVSIMRLGVMRMRVRPPRIRECDSLSVGTRKSEWVGDMVVIESERVGDISVGRHWNDSNALAQFRYSTRTNNYPSLLYTRQILVSASEECYLGKQIDPVGLKKMKHEQGSGGTANTANGSILRPKNADARTGESAAGESASCPRWPEEADAHNGWLDLVVQIY